MKNNKGFTLVELIIVIAIIAIITVVLAPQYLKYVEKSKVNMDENAIGEMIHAAEVGIVEAHMENKYLDGKVTITVNSAGEATFEWNGEGGDASAFATIYNSVYREKYEFKSKTYKAGVTLELDCVTGQAIKK